MESKSRLKGLLVYRSRWGLSARGWIIIGCAILLLLGALGWRLNGFLALTAPAPSAPALVMEGWVHGVGVNRAAAEFRAGHYQHLITTGGPMPTDRLDTGPTWAESGAYWLRRAGVPPENIISCPALRAERDRTYTSALALKGWLAVNAPTIRAINIVSEDVHARRTRLLFQKALGPEFTVGILSARNPDYDGARWWYSSEGVRETLGEAIAYAYVRFFFWP